MFPKKIILLAYLIFIPYICLPQNRIDEIPEELRSIRKSEYQSANVAVYMETCIKTLHFMFTQRGIPTSKSRIGSFQICGCSFDKIRTKFDEETYLTIMKTSDRVFKQIVDENIKECTLIYSDYWIKGGSDEKIET
tara:strand:+ start:2990 stop:3397 length:408 start_codon:yes stop_codon:yes gene_type:complete